MTAVGLRGTKWSWEVALILAFVASAGVTIFLRNSDHKTSGDSEPSLGSFDPRVLNPDDPTQPLIIDGRLVTLQAAAETIGAPLLRPNHPVASDETLTQVWVGTWESPSSALRYASGVRVYLNVWPPRRDPETDATLNYQEVASGNGVGSYKEINGHPAFVVAEDAQMDGYPSSTVAVLTIGRIEVEIHGHVSLSQILEIAASIR